MFQKQPGVVAKRLDKGNIEFHPFNTKAVIVFQLNWDSVMVENVIPVNCIS